MPNILLAAHDVGPSKALALVAKSLRESGANVFESLLNGKNPDPGVIQLPYDTDMVFLGISSPAKNAEFELAIAQAAIKAGVAIALFADTFGAWSREWFAHLRDRVSLLIVASEPEIAAAEKLYCNARVVATGNPNWDAYFAPAPRGEARAKLGVTSEFTVLVSGVKKLIQNILLWSEMGEYSRSEMDESTLIFIAPHPGDENERALYAPLFEMTENPNFRYLPEGVTSDTAIPGVDAVVHLGNSSPGLHALCRRIPVIDMVSVPLVDAYINGEIGGWKFAPQTYDATYVAGDRFDLSAILEDLRTGHLPQKSQFLTAREKGECARQIAGVLITACS